MILRMTEDQYALHQKLVKDHPMVAPEPQEKPRRNKYGAVPTEVDGIRFHSKAEAAYYVHLKWREQAGEITNLQRQVPYVLRVNGYPITRYISDFEWNEADGRHRVVDVKGFRRGQAYTLFKVKQKLMKALRGIEVEEV